jgi:hypothetical protein
MIRKRRYILSYLKCNGKRDIFHNATNQMNPKKKRKDREVHKSGESIQLPVKIIKRETQMRKKKEESGHYAYTNTSKTYQTGNPNERGRERKK